MRWGRRRKRKREGKINERPPTGGALGGRFAFAVLYMGSILRQHGFKLYSRLTRPVLAIYGSSI
jgi:hypothetical protein